MRVFRGIHHPGIAPALRAHDRQFRRRAPRPPGHAGPADAARRAIAACPRCVLTFEPHPRDYFAARLSGKPDMCAHAHRHAARQTRRTGTLRHRPGGGAALRRQAFAAQSPQGLHRRRAGRRAWARATCWWATTSASAPGGPATTRCSTPPARPRLRRGAHEQLRGARPARVELGGARRTRPRRHGRGGRAAGPALQHQRPRGAWRQTRPHARLSHPEPAIRAPAAGGDGHLRGAGP